MKKYLIAAVSLLALCGCTQDLKNRESKGTAIVCFGDSLTAGYGVQAGDDYPSKLAAKVPMSVINAGVSGNIAADGLARIDEDALSRNPYMVIIEFSGNDYMQQVPLVQTVSAVESMITRTQQAGAIAVVAETGGMLMSSAYGKEFKTLCKKHKALFIPAIMKGILTDPSLKSDAIHPNAKGYAMIADRVYAEIKPYLKK